MYFLLFTVFFLVLFFTFAPKLLPPIVHKIVTVIAKPESEEVKKKSELHKLNLEIKKVHMVDEFAKYAKIERKIVKIKDELKEHSKVRKSLSLKIKMAATAVLYTTQVISTVFMIYTYRAEPLLLLPAEWFWPVSIIIAFPTGISGAIGITFWAVVCRTVINKTMLHINNMNNAETVHPGID